MNYETSSIASNTGKLFGDLWKRYDTELFEESVTLFSQRFARNGFDLGWFKGKKCLDAGCGGGRFVIAMARLGASEVVGCDISKEGLENARWRAESLSQVRFETASVLSLPYEEESFDFVCCSGVLHHTTDPEKGLGEISRVLKKGGFLYLLLYGSGGLHWPTLMAVRPLAHKLGYALLDEALQSVDLPPNKQKNYLDDLFVPIIRCYSWKEVQEMLAQSFIDIKRWENARLDHEQSPYSQRQDLLTLRTPFQWLKGSYSLPTESRTLASLAYDTLTQAIKDLDTAVSEYETQKITQEERDTRVIGWGHHRILAKKN